MRRLINLRILLTAAILTGAAFGAGDSATAGGYCGWTTVTVQVPVRKVCVQHVTRYDECGRPYLARVVVYKTVLVPVAKRIPVCG